MTESTEAQHDEPATLSLSVEPTGRGETVTVIATLRREGKADEELHRDQVNLNRANHRTKFGRAIHDKLPRFTPLEIESQLLKLRADLERSQDANDDRPSQGKELDALELTRPELVIRPGFTAIAVSRLMESRSGPDGIWTLYTKSGSKRSQRELEPSIIMGERALHVHPMPPQPSPSDATELCGWSKPSREAWLRGEVRPTTTQVLERVMQRIDQFIELPNEEGTDEAFGYGATLSLWVMLSYCYPVFAAVPYLYLAGPAGSGKTRTMDLIGRMVFRPMFSSNTTAANVFRSLHARGGTLLLDEAERLKDDRSPDVAETTSILLSGYRRGGRASRLEPSGDSFRSVSFDVYGPKLLACIRGLPPALSSRCISVRLSRAPSGSPRASRSLDDSPAEGQAVRDLLHCWMLEHASQLFDTPAPASTLANRDAERWEPLLRIAKLTGDMSFVNVVLDHAARQIEVDNEDSTPEADPSLLRALFELVTDTPRVAPGDVLDAAKDIDPDAFDEGWNARRVSAVLRRYGMRTVRSNGRRVYRVDASSVESVARRYGYAVREAAS